MDFRTTHLLTFFLNLLTFCYTQEETVYKFWTESVQDMKSCKNKELIAYADKFLSEKCEVSYEDANVILKRTLCHATSLAAALVCSGAGFSEDNNHINLPIWNAKLPISDICGNEGMIRYSNVNLFESSSSRDLNENLHKILGACSDICNKSMDMLNVCSTFIRFCRVAFKEDESRNNAANPDFDYKVVSGKAAAASEAQAKQQSSEQHPVAVKQKPSTAPVSQVDSVEKLNRTKSPITEAKDVVEVAASKSTSSNTGAIANKVDEKAAVDRAFFTANKSVKSGGEIMEPSSDSKFATLANGSDRRKLADFKTPTFYTADGKRSSFSEYVPWFLLIGLVIVILYALTLKKNRVIACIVEGKRPKRPGRATNSFQHNSENKMSSAESRHFRVDLDSSDDDEEGNTFNDAAPMLKNF